MNKQILVIIAGMIFLSYAVYCQVKWSFLPSYSKSYFELKKDKRWIFQVWVLSLAILVIMIGNKIPYYIFSGLLSLVAFFPTIKNKEHFKWHITGAMGSIIGLMVYLNIEYWEAGNLSLAFLPSLSIMWFQILIEPDFDDIFSPPNWIKYLETFAFSYITLILYYNV